MTDADLHIAAKSVHGAGFTITIERAGGRRHLIILRDSTGTEYRASHPHDEDDAGWGRLITSLHRNHVVREWVRTTGPWNDTQVQAAGWPVTGRTARATLPDGSTTIIEISKLSVYNRKTRAMALNFKESGDARIARLNTVTALLNLGFLDIYSGAQPANPDAATSGTLLASLPLSATAFAGAVSDEGSPEVVTALANAITSASAAATGTAGYFRAFKADHTTAVCDGSIGTAGCDLNLNTVSITSGGTVSVTGWTITAP